MNIKIQHQRGKLFLWTKKCNCIFFECCSPIWWLPKIEKVEYKTFNGLRIGFLYFAIGYVKYKKYIEE
ncbi:MAG: hypothetical protein N4A63_13805 [Vallitalea sp.]|jgi:hypothetical protein|nr:hypothetical protein [Vallitalea sp.]